MDSTPTLKNSPRLLGKNQLSLPSLVNGLESSLQKGDTFSVDGTNVVRVPFGVRQPKKKKPKKPHRVATLVLPFQSFGNPNPPPQAA